MSRKLHAWETSSAASSSDRPLHDWETKEPGGNNRQTDNPEEEPWNQPEGSDDEPDTELPPGEMLVHHLLHLFLVNKISAEDCCVAMYYSAESGNEAARQYSLKPGGATTHYNRKLKGCLGHLNSPELYQVEVPGHSKHNLSRTVHTLHMLPFHEQLAKEWRESPELDEKLAALTRAGILPPAYHEHPVVREAAAAGRNAVPIAIYLDGVPHTLTDSVLGWWAVNLVSGRRHLFGLLRKSLACHCGCRGWCSLWPFFKVAVWSLRALAAGLYPESRHNGASWETTDKFRQELSGQSLGVVAACLYVKGDWSEYSSSLGFPAWNDGYRPCFECNGFGEDLFCPLGNSMSGLRWRENGPSDYYTACNRCTKSVLVQTPEAHTALVRTLRYDKRPSGLRGRVLSEGVQECQLRAGMRLEPSDEVQDIGKFEELATPFTACFWDVQEETLARHANPLFEASLGMAPQRCLTIDTLHAVYLGVMKVYVRVCIWFILQSGIFGSIGTADENLITACMAMQSSLMSWYKMRHAENPQENLTRISSLKPKMIGSRTAPVLKTKAAETWGLLLFMVHVLDLYGQRLGSDCRRLLTAGRDLETIVRIFKGHGWTIPARRLDDAMAAYRRHLTLMSPFGVFTPKHHLTMHMLKKASFLGNPTVYATWKDESLNKLLKTACRNAASCTLERMVLLRMRDLLKVDALPPRKRTRSPATRLPLATY